MDSWPPPEPLPPPEAATSVQDRQSGSMGSLFGSVTHFLSPSFLIMATKDKLFFACLKYAAEAGAALKSAAPAPGSGQKKIGSGSATLGLRALFFN